jgi:hypothetical protein
MIATTRCERHDAISRGDELARRTTKGDSSRMVLNGESSARRHCLASSAVADANVSASLVMITPVRCERHDTISRGDVLTRRTTKGDSAHARCLTRAAIRECAASNSCTVTPRTCSAIDPGASWRVGKCGSAIRAMSRKAPLPSRWRAPTQVSGNVRRRQLLANSLASAKGAFIYGRCRSIAADHLVQG